MMNDDTNALVLETMPSKRVLRDRIDRLSASADAKAILNDLLDVVIDVGGRMSAKTWRSTPSPASWRSQSRE
ncbi:MAG: hypothetical protein JSR79_07040 [Proteobacteria bacterium]|nr:hypothetical protein [Pseudomonadota bacterium]